MNADFCGNVDDAQEKEEDEDSRVSASSRRFSSGSRKERKKDAKVEEKRREEKTIPINTREVRVGNKKFLALPKREKKTQTRRHLPFLSLETDGERTTEKKEQKEGERRKTTIGRRGAADECLRANKSKADSGRPGSSSPLFPSSSRPSSSLSLQRKEREQRTKRGKRVRERRKRRRDLRCQLSSAELEKAMVKETKGPLSVSQRRVSETKKASSKKGRKERRGRRESGRETLLSPAARGLLFLVLFSIYHSSFLLRNSTPDSPCRQAFVEED